ncbi:MAG: tetratricopeptide repeat protein [Bradymonadales bacterium]|nr:tetratricopeptide repeat protein [Bradymonadales bacterium]
MSAIPAVLLASCWLALASPAQADALAEVPPGLDAGLLVQADAQDGRLTDQPPPIQGQPGRTSPEPGDPDQQPSPLEDAPTSAASENSTQTEPMDTGVDVRALVGEGYRLLDWGDDQGAEEAFLKALQVDPVNREAAEGLMWTYVRRGEFEQAAEAADRRLGLDPDGTFTDQWLVVIGMAPTRREEAIAIYRQRIEAEPSAIEPRLRLAELLSWTISRRPEAIQIYREVLAIDPASQEATLGLALVLSWEGERAEADALFDAILAEEPHHLEALLGRARSARWQGEWELARHLYDRALEIEGGHPDLRAERIQLEIDPALQAAHLAMAREMEAREGAGLANLGRIALAPTYSQDSNGFARLNLRLEGEVNPLAATRARLLAGFTRFTDDLDELDRITLGGELRQGLPLGFFVRAGYYTQLYRGAPNSHEANGEVGLDNPAWPVQVRGGFHQHAQVDPLPAKEQIAYLAGVGSSGLTTTGIREVIQLRDLYLSFSWSPLPGAYLYGDGAFGWMNDRNRRFTVGGGLGVDLLRMVGQEVAHELIVKYDYFLLAYEHHRDTYWSPGSFQVHTPGLGWIWRHPGQRWTLGGELGAPIDPVDGSVGYRVEAFCRTLLAGRWELQGRALLVDDTEFALYAGTLGLGFMF